MNVLVTGGAGYIGSHAVKRLLRRGATVSIVDSVLPGRGNLGAVRALRSLPGSADRLHFVQADIGDRAILDRTLRERKIDAVMHFAALAYVRESVDQPLAYYINNTQKAIALLDACDAAGVRRFVLSSTCATYGSPADADIPVREDSPQRPITPYGWSKLFVERALIDHAAACARVGKPFACAMLRYFNVAGSDPEGLLGEDHNPETHLIPTLLQVAQGRREPMTVFGTDLPTPDGTCVRDYIHVEDLVEAHALALEAIDPARHEARAYNLGTGEGLSVRQIVESCRRVTGLPVPIKEGPAHPGDALRLWADASKAKRELQWTPRFTRIDEIVRTAWDWMRAHPNGYGG